MGSLKTFDILKGWETGQIAAILYKVSGGDREKLEAILRNEFEIKLEEKILRLFDQHGRRIPHNLENRVVDANRKFYLNQPKMETTVDFANRLLRVEGFFGRTGFTAENFEKEIRKLEEKIRQDKAIANLMECPYFPVVIPKTKVDDHGEILEQKFIPVVKQAYQEQFPNRKFYNWREGDLKAKVDIVEDSRHDELVREMRKGAVAGIHFANPLHGFSVLASREQMTTLPDGFVLSGYGSLVAITMYPDELARDYQTPGYDLSAFSWGSSGCSLCCGASVGRLDFVCRAVLSVPFDSYSSGLLFLG